MSSKFGIVIGCLAVGMVAVLAAPAAGADEDRPDFPPSDEVLKGYEKVVSTAGGQASLYTLWTRKKDGKILAALPSNYAGTKYFFAMTIASGDTYAGLQAGDMYVYWKRYDKRLALIEPNIVIRSDGDQESRNSVKRLFTDRVILDVPILTMFGGRPVIDLNNLLLGQASKFFGSSINITNRNLVTIKKAKAFPKNVEVAFEVPTSRGGGFFLFSGTSSSNGKLQTLHYSISEIPENTGYRTRKADERIGFFTTHYSDLGQFKHPETKVRYINRWKLEKADPSLDLSPPKEPIVFYIEHTTPVRYRRWVREGILYWNEAFEKVGLANAIEVDYQDKASGAHMEKDPEDVRYNFVRWLSNDAGTAIGPSRVHPMTGQILDADIILTDGWIRHFWIQYHQVMPKLAMEGFNPQLLAWLSAYPNWDPRVRLAPPAQRQQLIEQIAEQSRQPFAGHALAGADAQLIGDDEYDGLAGRTSQLNGLCIAAEGKAFDVAMMRMALAMNHHEDDGDAGEGKDEDEDDEDDEDKDKEKEKKKEPMIDGIPESFIGPMLAELVAHEVGHTLGLRHNFKSSAVYTLEQINSDEIKGKKTLASSVMDYLAANMNFEGGPIQGDYSMIGVGPYDKWAIEYGYTFDSDLKPILNRVAEPELQYATDEDTFGPDPLARRYDFTSNPLDYAHNQMRLVNYHRERILEHFVKEGESWAQARRGYEMTLAMQVRTLSMMANWLGGAFINHDRKGDENGRVPIEVVPAEKQREALEFVIDHAFKDDAFGLTHDLLNHMTIDKWWDSVLSIFLDSTWPVHDRVMGIQASSLTMLMNPMTLQRIYDNEFRVSADEDALTLPELLGTLTTAIWSELDTLPEKQYSARKPMVSSLRRNLQREHLERLIDLSMPSIRFIEVYKPISDLARVELRQIKESRIDWVLKTHGERIDPYTRAHLADAGKRIEKALDPQFIYR